VYVCVCVMLAIVEASLIAFNWAKDRPKGYSPCSKINRRQNPREVLNPSSVKKTHSKVRKHKLLCSYIVLHQHVSTRRAATSPWRR
jgi:hypothetical protein